MVPFDLLAELSPPGVRGSVLNASNWMWSIGSIVVALTAAWSVETMNAEGWRLLVAISSVCKEKAGVCDANKKNAHPY
jgi:MFS family permease